MFRFQHINHPILGKKSKSKLRKGPRKPSDIEEDSIREKTKAKVEDPSAEEVESLSEKIEPNSKELISMPNGNDKNVKENVQVKAELKSDEKGKAVPPVKPPIKQPQNIVKQSSTQPEPCINSTFGAQTAKTAVLGPPLAAAVQLPLITAPNSASTPPDAPTQTHDLKTHELIPANIPLYGTPTHDQHAKQLTMSQGILTAAAVPPHPVSSLSTTSSPNVAKYPQMGAAIPVSPLFPGTSQPGTESANNCVTAKYPATGPTTPRTLVSVTGTTPATRVKPSAYVPGTQLDPSNVPAPANSKNPAPPGKQQPQSEKGNSDSEGSSEGDSVETAMDISTIPLEERAKYSFLRKGKSKDGAFTLRGEDTLAMKDLDLFDCGENKQAPQMDMKALHDYFAQPVDASKPSSSKPGITYSPRNVKKKKRKRKSGLLKAMFRDKKKKTTVKTPPTAQKT